MCVCGGVCVLVNASFPAHQSLFGTLGAAQQRLLRGCVVTLTFALPRRPGSKIKTP